jgi:molybdopterin converting factor small subunit
VPYVWVALRNGRDLLDADDTLTDSDELEFLPPILGG